MSKPGTLHEGEPHPAAAQALEWLKTTMGQARLHTAMEAFASAAIMGNRLAEICMKTTQRILTGEPVSDRYVLGLCWTLRDQHQWSPPPTNRDRQRGAL